MCSHQEEAATLRVEKGHLLPTEGEGCVAKLVERGVGAETLEKVHFCPLKVRGSL